MADEEKKDKTTSDEEVKTTSEEVEVKEEKVTEETETKTEETKSSEESEEKTDEKADSDEETKEDAKSEDKTDDKPESEDSEEEDAKSEEIVPELSNQYHLPSAGEVQSIHHKSFKRVLIGVLIVISLAILAAGAIWMTHDSPVSQNESEIVYIQGAAVTAVEGEVEYNRGTGWEVVGQGTSLKEGDSLRTMEGSRAIITLDEGSAIRLDSNTVVTLTKLTVGEVTVTNGEGQVYSRVVPSEARVFIVTVGEQEYQSVGTAYITVNTEEEKGVEVFHSKVNAIDKAEVSEGETYYTENKDANKQGKVAKLDLSELEKDEFVNWNKTKDEAVEDFADKLGVLKELGKEAEKEEEETPVTTPGTPAGITLNGYKGSKGIELSWVVNGINTADGFKVVYDKTDTTPTYGENSAQYVEAEARATKVKLIDGKSWNLRICAYRKSSGTCDSYSNLITVTAPKVELPVVKTGTVTLDISGNVLGWSLTGGTAPYGFKVVYNTTGDPEYPGDNPTFVNGQVYEINTGSLADGTYYFRVCKYNENLENNPSKCLDYSNEVTYTKT